MKAKPRPEDRAATDRHAKPRLGRGLAWSALVPLALLAACNRATPDQGSLNEGVAQPENDLVAPEILNQTPPVINAAPPPPVDRIIEPNLSADEQVIDDAEATGMTARSRPVPSDGVSPALDRADRHATHDAESMEQDMAAEDAADPAPAAPSGNQPARKDVNQ